MKETFFLVVVSSASGVDLSKHNVLASKKVTSSITQQLLQQPQLPHQPKNGSRTTISADVYASLLMQLRQVAANDANSGVKLTAAARKERLKCQPCFQCPVCKKRSVFRH